MINNRHCFPDNTERLKKIMQKCNDGDDRTYYVDETEAVLEAFKKAIIHYGKEALK